MIEHIIVSLPLGMDLEVRFGRSFEIDLVSLRYGSFIDRPRGQLNMIILANRLRVLERLGLQVLSEGIWKILRF